MNSSCGARNRILMSARRATIQLTPRARRDVQNILAHSRRTWGARQAANYQGALTRALSLLRDHPLIGQPRDDLFPDCHTMQIERHVIYYHQPQPHEIEVIRILHDRQDPTGKVSQPPL